MQYAILIYETDEAFGARADDARFPSYIAPFERYVAELREAGVFVGGDVLREPSTATTVRDRQIQDGPVAHSHEQLGGFLLIEVPDLDAALRWALACPSAAAEVRPIGMRP
jgi:hypothetical protein